MFNTATRCYEMTDASGSYDWITENWDPKDHAEMTDAEIAEYADELIAQAIEQECVGLEDEAHALTYPQFGHDVGTVLESPEEWLEWSKDDIRTDLEAEKDYVVSFLREFRDTARRG